MKKLIIFLFLVFVLSACGAPLVSPDIVLGTPQPNVPTRTARPADDQAPEPSALQDLYAGLHGTETAVGLWREQLDREQAELQLQLIRDAATSTAGAQMTETAAQNAMQTSVAGTQVAQIQI